MIRAPRRSVMVGAVVAVAVAGTILGVLHSAGALPAFLPTGPIKVAITWQQVEWEQHDTYGSCAAGNGSFSGTIAGESVHGVLAESCGSNIVESTGTLRSRGFSLHVDLIGNGLPRTSMEVSGTIHGSPITASVIYDSTDRFFRVTGSIAGEQLSGTARFAENADYTGGNLTATVTVG